MSKNKDRWTETQTDMSNKPLGFRFGNFGNEPLKN